MLSSAAMMRSRSFRILLLLALVTLPGAAIAVETAAPVASLEIDNLRLGVDGQYKVGHWTPVAVELDHKRFSESDHVYFETVDSDGIRVRFEAATEAPTSATITARSHVKFGCMTS